MNRNLWGVVVVLVLLVAGRVLVGLSAQRNDRAEILQALRDSIQAGKEGKAGSVLDKLSGQFKYNDQDARGSLGDISRFVREQRPDVTVKNPNPIISGDQARITSDVDLSLSLLGQSQSMSLKNVVIVFQRETGTIWGVIPAQQWHISEVRAPDAEGRNIGN